MSKRLTMGMYGTEFNAVPNGLFGLSCGKLQAGCVVRDAGWYNVQGEKLGWGDLTPDDFRRIAAELEPDEMFIILDKYGSHFDLPPGVDEAKPGTDYICDKCLYVIVGGVFYKVSDLDDTGAFEFCGLPMQTIRHSAIGEIICRAALEAG